MTHLSFIYVFTQNICFLLAIWHYIISCNNYRVCVSDLLTPVLHIFSRPKKSVTQVTPIYSKLTRKGHLDQILTKFLHGHLDFPSGQGWAWPRRYSSAPYELQKLHYFWLQCIEFWTWLDGNLSLSSFCTEEFLVYIRYVQNLAQGLHSLSQHNSKSDLVVGIIPAFSFKLASNDWIVIQKSQHMCTWWH